MIRSGFKRPTLARPRTVHTPVPEHLRRSAMTAVVGIPRSAIPKDNALHSEPYRRLVAAFPCINCGNVMPAGCRPSKIASTMSGTRSVNRSARLT